MRSSTKVAGDPLPPNAIVVNLSGLTLSLPAVVGPVLNVTLADVWGAEHVSTNQMRGLVDALVGLQGQLPLRAVCNAGRNRSRFAASLYCIMFRFEEPPNGAPETNRDLQALLRVARQCAEESSATAAAIGDAVVSAVTSLSLPSTSS